MLSFFKKKAAKSEEAANGKTMKAYLTGKVIPIEELNDGVFSAKIMGDGIAIIPENEVLTAPADGEITVVMDGSFHAVGMRLDNGVEVLLHIGVDTVGMNGEGFKPYVTVGDKVKTGDNSNATLFAILLLVSGTGLLIIAISRYREKYHK